MTNKKLKQEQKAKELGEQLAFPNFHKLTLYDKFSPMENMKIEYKSGLTKREYFASLYQGSPREAVNHADALLLELVKESEE